MAANLPSQSALTIQISAFLVSVPNDLAKPTVPTVPTIRRAIDAEMDRALFESDLLALEDGLIKIPDIVGKLNIQVLGLKWNLDKSSIEFDRLMQKNRVYFLAL